MFELLITKNVAYAAKSGGGTIAGINEVNDLAEGALAIFTDAGELVTNANASTIFENRREFYFALGGDGVTKKGATISDKVHRLNVTQYTKKDYTAPAKQKIIVGVGSTETDDGLPASLDAGDYIRLRIFDTTNATLPNQRIERYEYRIKTGDTPAIVYATLVAMINAKSQIGTAVAHGSAGSEDGFAFTCNEFGQTAQLLFDDLGADIPVDYSNTANGVVLINYGIGTPAQVAAMEEEANTILGDTNKVYLRDRYFNRATSVDSSATYDIYTLVHQGIKQGAISQQPTVRKQIIIAMPDGATMQTVFQTIMGYALAEANAVFNGIES